MNAAPERLVVPVPGAVLAGERHRGEGPLIVLAHAGVADRRAWSEVAGRLAARGADVVAYDRRGFGETPAATGPFRHLDDLLAVLDGVGRGPAWLVGNSMGGALAIDAALEAPQRVAGLVLLAPAVSGQPEPGPESLDAATLAIWEAFDRVPEDDLEAINRLEVRLWLDGPDAPEGRVGGRARELALDMNRIALASGAGEAGGESGIDAWSRIEEIRRPVALAWGELDVPLMAATCRALAARLPDVREIRELPGVAHLAALERPDLVAELVANAAGA